MAAAEPYLLQAGVASEEERLRIQAEAWEPEVEIWLDQIGVQPGWRCVDLGCGPMGILAPLSRRAEWRGRVVGVESSPTHAEAARQFVSDNRLESVEVLAASPFDPPLECGSFHLAHARFMLAALEREEELLREMVSLVRPGGIVALQEPDASSWNCYPARPAFRRLVSAIQDVYAEAGGDFNAGRHTFGMVHRLGLADVQVRAAVVACSGARQPFRSALLHQVMALRKPILQGDILTQPELDEAVADVRQALDDPGTLVLSYTVTQVWGRKT
jgi:SAM-dependent methyltransferase